MRTMFFFAFRDSIFPGSKLAQEVYTGIRTMVVSGFEGVFSGNDTIIIRMKYSFSQLRDQVISVPLNGEHCKSAAANLPGEALAYIYLHISLKFDKFNA